MRIEHYEAVGKMLLRVSISGWSVCVYCNNPVGTMGFRKEGNFSFLSSDKKGKKWRVRLLEEQTKEHVTKFRISLFSDKTSRTSVLTSTRQIISALYSILLAKDWGLSTSWLQSDLAENPRTCTWQARDLHVFTFRDTDGFVHDSVLHIVAAVPSI